jgi:predicted nucleic acid binding AN1-type Zn finger protein
MRCKCKSCKVKLTLVDKAMPCKCKKCFCPKHRLPDSHQCTFDHKAAKLQALKMQLKDANFSKVTAI